MNKFSNTYNPNTSSLNQETRGEVFSDIDLGKILGVIRKNLIWVMLINLLAFILGWLYLRYTKPLYVSSSSLKIAIENEKNVQGLEGIIGLNPKQDDNLAGEIQFIASELIAKIVAEKLKLDISYFAEGNILDSEIYKSSPFKVLYDFKQVAAYDMRFYVRILDKKNFEFSYEQGNEEVKKRYSFGEKINYKGAYFTIFLNGFYSPKEHYLKYYFIVNSTQSSVRYIRSRLVVGLGSKEAKTINLSFSDHNTYKARDIIMQTDSVYMVESVKEKNKSNVQQIQFLDQKLAEFEDSLLLYESKIQGFYLENKTKDTDEKLKKALENLENQAPIKEKIRRKLVLLKELELLIVNEGNIKEFIPSMMLLENDKISSQVESYSQLIEDKKKLNLSHNEGKTYRQDAIDIKFNSAKENMLLYVNGAKRILNEQIRDINLKIAEAEEALLGHPTKSREYNKINRLYSKYNELYNSLLSNKIQIEIAKAGVVPKCIILSPANLPSIPVSPIQYQIYAVSAVGGLFLSLGLIVLQYLLHNTITTQAELEKIVNAPILGSIPEYKKEKMAHTRLIVSRNQKSSINEALRSIRTNLEFMLPTGKGLHDLGSSTLLSVTSTISGEGKTFVASNLGGIIAMTELKVIILDFDMRKPKLHLAFDAENDQGVSSILIGKRTVEQCIQNTEIKNLDFISSGPTPPNPSELILREDFDLMLIELKKMYDVIIIDTPPVGLVTDGILIMKKVDMPIYITRANYSKRFFGRNINRLIQSNNFNNLAVILNSVKRNAGSYGYGNYGGYGGYYGGYYGGGYYEDYKDSQNWWSKFKQIGIFKKK